MTATNIRKWIVTMCHKKKAEGTNIDELTLRQAMCHSTRAAEHFYLRESVTHTGVEAAKIIESCTSVMPEPPSAAENSENEQAPATSVQPTAAPAGESAYEEVSSVHPLFQEPLSAVPCEN